MSGTIHLRNYLKDHPLPWSRTLQDNPDRVTITDRNNNQVILQNEVTDIVMAAMECLTREHPELKDLP